MYKCGKCGVIIGDVTSNVIEGFKFWHNSGKPHIGFLTEVDSDIGAMLSAKEKWVEGWLCRCGTRYAWFQKFCPYCKMERYEKPKVGDGVTLLLWSDRHAYTISRVSKSGNIFWMKRDIAILDKSFKPEMVEGGFVAHTTNNHEQKYNYTPDPKADEVRVTKTKKGWHCRKGMVGVGRREEYYDYNF